MKKKHDPRSEAAQREALKGLGVKLKAYLSTQCVGKMTRSPTEVFIRDYDTNEILAIFDLNDLPRKREPLTGITKKLRKAIQPKRR